MNNITVILLCQQQHLVTQELNVYNQIVASQIASVVESGNLRQLLWRDPLKQDADDLISEKLNMHRIHVMVLECGCLVLVAIFRHQTL